MLTYVLRRILLFVPTILGATFLIFALLSAAPISITDTLLPPGGDMQPGVREEREAYLNERYGLDSPWPLRYARWLNNASPIGLQVWAYDDELVIEKRAQRRVWREQVQSQLQQEQPSLSGDALRQAVNEVEDKAAAAGEVDFTPKPGQFRWDKVPIKSPDLGESYIWRRSVASLIAERLPVTLLLNALSLPLALFIAIFTGVWSARHRGKIQDWGTGTLLLGLYSIPTIWTGVMAIGFLANVQYVKWFPAAGTGSLAAQAQTFFPSFSGGFEPGYLLDATWHLALPVLVLTYGQFAYLSKLTRTSMLETLSADFVRTARAKGLSSGVVLWRHAFRNALSPIITVLASLLPIIVAGSIVVERIFSIDGMGSLVLESLFRGDNEVFLSTTLVTLLLTIVSYLIADIAYAIADPRVSYE